MSGADASLLQLAVRLARQRSFDCSTLIERLRIRGGADTQRAANGDADSKHGASFLKCNAMRRLYGRRDTTVSGSQASGGRNGGSGTKNGCQATRATICASAFCTAVCHAAAANAA